MEVVEQTPTLLVTQCRPDKRRLLIAAAMLFSAIGILILCLTDSVVTLTCRWSAATNGKIELVTSSLFGSRTREAPVEAVTRVVIKPGKSRGNGGVVLLTNTGEFSLATLSSGRANQLAGRLTAFLSAPGSPDLTVRQDSRLSTYGISFGIIAVGVLVLALGFETVVCTFDKEASRIAIQRKGLLGTRRAEYYMREVADLRTEWVSNRKKGKVVYLVLKSGARVHAGWPGNSGAVDATRRFLGLNGGR